MSQAVTRLFCLVDAVEMWKVDLGSASSTTCFVHKQRPQQTCHHLPILALQPQQYLDSPPPSSPLLYFACLSTVCSSSRPFRQGSVEAIALSRCPDSEHTLMPSSQSPGEYQLSTFSSSMPGSRGSRSLFGRRKDDEHHSNEEAEALLGAGDGDEQDGFGPNAQVGVISRPES